MKNTPLDEFHFYATWQARAMRQSLPEGTGPVLSEGTTSAGYRAAVAGADSFEAALDAITAHCRKLSHLEESQAVLVAIGRAKAAIRGGSTDDAAKAGFAVGVLVEDWRSKDKAERTFIRGVKNVISRDKAETRKHDLSEEDGAKLTRRFDALGDDLTPGEKYKRIAKDLKKGSLSLTKPMKDPTPEAVARKIQRYRKPLR
jgi:hypothetical protein